MRGGVNTGGTYLVTTHKTIWGKSLCPMLAKPEKVSFSPVEKASVSTYLARGLASLHPPNPPSPLKQNSQ